jgi:UDP-glucose 4-epimerase
MSNILVTGGCGFIGSHLVDRLIGLGHELVVLDNLSNADTSNLHPEATFIEGDITDVDCVNDALATADACVHLAAVSSVQASIDDWIGTHEINATGSLNIFNAARRDKTPVIYASSAAVYGNCDQTPLSETLKTTPLTAYGADKLATEHNAAVAWLVHLVPSIGLRFFNVFGPRQNPNSPYSGVISIFNNRISSQKPVTLFGDGSQQRDFIYVDDVVDSLVLALDHAKSDARVFNICTGVATDLITLANHIGEAYKLKPTLEYKPTRTGDIHTSVGDPHYAKQTLNFSASRPLKAALEAYCQTLQIDSPQ